MTPDKYQKNAVSDHNRSVRFSLAKVSTKDMLRQSEEQLQTTCSQLQAANEKLQAQSEELQAQREELQTQNEELRTQREELQEQNNALALLWEKSRQTEEALAESRERLRLALS